MSLRARRDHRLAVRLRRRAAGDGGEVAAAVPEPAVSGDGTLPVRPCVLGPEGAAERPVA
ncbi:hypothetical protein [Streptomyces avicenniae]|uniref:hypothetical protein n=1 Tax=Streptomyces avicenniae TaxID=500153 RepID=UPI00167E632F|nr:hypothetical protein [Streptomyces avicenniae]